MWFQTQRSPEKKKRRAGAKPLDLVVARNIRGVRILDEGEEIDKVVVPLVRPSPAAAADDSSASAPKEKAPLSRMNSAVESQGAEPAEEEEEEAVNQLPAVPPGFGDVTLRHVCEECFGRFATSAELRAHGKVHRSIPQKM